MTSTEATQIKQPAINPFKETGRQTLDRYAETYCEDSLPGRDNRSEVVLTRELHEALTQIKDYQK